MLIAQITDFHVTVSGARVGDIDTRAAFTALVARLAALRPQPDLLLVSGDLAEAGVDDEYAFVRSGLESLRIPFLAVPGNHDLRAPMRRVLGGSTGQAGDHLCLDGSFDSLRIIGLDTLVEGRAHGALDAARLAWLDAQLAAGEGQPLLIFMHHPPFATGLKAMDDIGLTQGREAFAALLRGRTDVVGILCGHVHRAISGMFAGHRTFIAPSASHQFAFDLTAPGFAVVREPPQIALHQLVEGRLVSYLRG